MSLDCIPDDVCRAHTKQRQHLQIVDWRNLRFLSQALEKRAPFRLRDSAVSDSRTRPFPDNRSQNSPIDNPGASMRAAFRQGMQATLPLDQTAITSKRKNFILPTAEGVSVEIHSYLAARDLLLREAEANTTESNLRRAWAANEFAENCLQPAPAPYQAQALPEAEAARERRRCASVKLRLAELRLRVSRRDRAA
jgi:hypothetical protein